eukprot:s2455_g7.t1
MAGRPPLSTVRRCCTELGLQSVACLGNEEHLSVGLPICNAFPVPRSEVPVRTAIAPRFELHGMQLSDVSDQHICKLQADDRANLIPKPPSSCPYFLFGAAMASETPNWTVPRPWRQLPEIELRAMDRLRHISRHLLAGDEPGLSPESCAAAASSAQPSEDAKQRKNKLVDIIRTYIMDIHRLRTTGETPSMTLHEVLMMQPPYSKRTGLGKQLEKAEAKGYLAALSLLPGPWADAQTHEDTMD